MIEDIVIFDVFKSELLLIAEQKDNDNVLCRQKRKIYDSRRICREV